MYYYIIILLFNDTSLFLFYLQQSYNFLFIYSNVYGLELFKYVNYKLCLYYNLFKNASIFCLYNLIKQVLFDINNKTPSNCNYTLNNLY